MELEVIDLAALDRQQSKAEATTKEEHDSCHQQEVLPFCPYCMERSKRANDLTHHHLHSVHKYKSCIWCVEGK